MRWHWIVGLLSGCADVWCPPTLDPFATCRVEHESCGPDLDCALGLECVSQVTLCTVGPCPGICRAACDGPGDCGEGESCDPVSGSGARFCIEEASPLAVDTRAGGTAEGADPSRRSVGP